MSRRSFGTSIRMIARAAAQAERANQQAQARAASAQIRAINIASRQQKADAKEAARLYITSRTEEADDLNQSIQERETAITSLLTRALSKNPKVYFEATRKSFSAAKFDVALWNSSLPKWTDFQPEPQGFFAKLVPGAAGRFAKSDEEAKRRFYRAGAEHREKIASKDIAFTKFEEAESQRKAGIEQHNSSVTEHLQRVAAGEHMAVVNYFKLTLGGSLEGEPDAFSAEVGYSPGSHHLVVDLELPEFSAVPEESGFKYVKSGDRIEAVPRPIAKRKALYGHLICQAALKCVATIFRSDPQNAVECLTLNGMLDTIDPATGQQVRVCLLSVRVTADTFRTLDLGKVNPEQCLRSLKASVSRSPDELLAVRPLLELDMVDPRFIDTLDVISGLEQRSNLMDLTPTEFEGLITNLFASMGLETRQTQASRDGGVDCVAFDPRPVFGGKVVIQAKRYKNTVGVSAVRDLFGTVQNEGASKGILVTTSHYGKAAYEFANGKPLELLDGPNLLYLLNEHAKMDARIVMPTEWIDPPIHGE
jgi:restriction system protein